MSENQAVPSRFIGLDIHKEYFVAAGVNPRQEAIFGPQRVPNLQLETWIKKQLKLEDAVVLEMTTNTYLFYDTLKPHVHSVTVVHPPHVALITRAQVKTDRKAALGLAQLLAAGLLTSVWIPPQEVRDLRALLAQRHKMVRMKTMSKNRLHAALQRHDFEPPESGALFSPEQRAWWEALSVSPLELTNVKSDLDTLAFAEQQIEHLTICLAELAGHEERVPLLVQLPGLGLIGAMTILSAIGDITRFESAKQLVGYAGLGARIHASGNLYLTGRITKAGRRDLRYTMVEAANKAARSHLHWQAELKRLEPRLGRSKAVVAIARKLLVVVWHVLTEEAADRFADPIQVAKFLYAHIFDVGTKNLPNGERPLAYTRRQLDRLKLGRDLTHLPWSGKQYKLPPSNLAG